MDTCEYCGRLLGGRGLAIPHEDVGNVCVTIKHILIDADYNDLGFSVGGRLVILVESGAVALNN